jgi:hypothetical protein
MRRSFVVATATCVGEGDRERDGEENDRGDAGDGEMRIALPPSSPPSGATNGATHGATRELADKAADTANRGRCAVDSTNTLDVVWDAFEVSGDQCRARGVSMRTRLVAGVPVTATLGANDTHLNALDPRLQPGATS